MIEGVDGNCKYNHDHKNTNDNNNNNNNGYGNGIEIWGSSCQRATDPPPPLTEAGERASPVYGFNRVLGTS